MNEKKALAAAVLVLATLMMGLSALPTSTHASVALPQVPNVHVSAPQLAAHVASASVRAAAVHPQTTFARTVLVEPFTEQWCEYCPAESQALYYTEHKYTSSYVVIAELHPCPGPASTHNYSNCADSWPTLDGIADYRSSTAVYSIQGYPTAVVDGDHQFIGALSAYPKTLEGIYERAIANASAIPGNVSITQTALITASNTVTVHASIVSGITGTYRALTYLTEAIDKNISASGGIHDIGTVVRASIINQSVSLTAGETLNLTGSVALSSSWNQLHLGAVTLVQDPKTRIMENANKVLVSNLNTAVAASAQTVTAGQTSGITVTATNSTTGAPITGAVVNLSLSGPGSLSPLNGTTSSTGTFTANFSAPSTTSQETATVTVSVTAPGYTAGVSVLALTIMPSFAPSTPTGLGLVPSDQQIVLQWTAPTSGAGGVTYHIYQSTSPTGPFSEIATLATTSLIDSGILGGQSYWFEVSAQNAAGWSANTTPIAAIPVQGVPSGLPASVSWWLQLGSMQFNTSGDQSVSLHVAPGPYTYNLGVFGNDYVAPTVSSGSIMVVSDAIQIPAAFTPNYAILQLSVTPTSAHVVLNGQALVLASDGTYKGQIVAGDYSLQVTSAGYAENTSTIHLTPGNSTTVAVNLQALPSTGSSPAVTLTGFDMAAIAGIAVLAVVGVVAALLLSKRRARGP